MWSVVVVVEAWQYSFSEGVAVGFLQRVMVSFNWGHLGLGCPKGGEKGVRGEWRDRGVSVGCVWVVPVQVFGD